VNAPAPLFREGDHLLRPDVTVPSPSFISGHGVELLRDDGRWVLDAASGVGVTCLGYDSERIVAAMAEQAERLPYVHALRFETPVMSELAARIAALAPGELDHCFFSSGGSEAAEGAVKFARQYWLERGRPGKWRVVGRRPSFHGNTIAALSIGWHGPRRTRHAPLMLDFPHIESPDLYRGCSYCGPGGCSASCAEQLDLLLEREGAETIAAFFAEPVVGAAAGAMPAPPGYFEAIREICDRHDVLFVADEVITGFGRTGRWFGIEHWDVVPDLLIFAKGVSAGFAPLGGMVVRGELLDAFRAGSHRFEHNFTMAGHPVACAAGVAAVDELQEIEAPELVAYHEPLLFAALEALREHPVVGDVRGLGFLAGIELVADRDSRRPFDPGLGVAARIGVLALEEGLLVYPGGGALEGAGDQVLVMPAFVTLPWAFPEIATRLGRALERLEAELVADGPG
jgi:adenosylmethionine-8-amino-7-oxononanoate aminotransferase